MNDKEHRIRLRAYEIWEREGRHDGRADGHWRQAEIEIERESGEVAAQAVAPEPSAKKVGKVAKGSAKAGAGASGSQAKAKGKPAASRSKKPSNAVKPTERRSPSSAPA